MNGLHDWLVLAGGAILGFLVLFFLRKSPSNNRYDSGMPPINIGPAKPDCPGMCGWSHAYEPGICDREEK